MTNEFPYMKRTEFIANIKGQMAAACGAPLSIEETLAAMAFYNGSWPALTELEEKVLRSIPKDDFFEHRFESEIWNDCFFDGTCPIPAKQGRAVLVSLEKKEFIELFGGKDGYTRLTDLGCAWLVNKGVLQQNGSPSRD